MSALYIDKPERVYGSNLLAGYINPLVTTITPKKRIETAGNILKKTKNTGENE